MSDRIVILGFLSHFPVAGVAWQTLHYLIGFQRLGFDVYYVEAHGCTPSKLMRSESDDGAVRAAAYIENLLRRFDLGSKWAYHAPYPEPRFFGLSQQQLRELYRSAALIVNLHGSHIPTEELSATNRLVYLETDPVDVEIDLFNGRQETREYLAPHCAFFTYGENIGQESCLVPAPDAFRFLPTRQPVLMDFWEQEAVLGRDVFTTIGNWRQPWREVTFKGQAYRWSKHWEFLKFIDLPSRTEQRFELALSRTSLRPEDEQLLQSQRWQVRDALTFSSDLDAYRQYIRESRAEFTVAKEQNICLRSGWFSDRAVTYLAASRPVVTQQTGFDRTLPVGKGLFAYSTMEELVAAVETINANYGHHCRAARQIAQEFFSYEVVLGRMLEDLGMCRGKHSRVSHALLPEGPPQVSQRPTEAFREIPDWLVLTPTGRWPTRLPEKTVQSALAFPVPVAQLIRPGPRAELQTGAQAEAFRWARQRNASIILVTHNGLLYTKLCLASLLVDWSAHDELVLVDNASTDGTVPYLQEVARLNTFVRLILNPENRGFAAANNQALEVAKGDILILLNNDTLISEGWRDRLISWLHDKRTGLVGPVTNRTCNEAQIEAQYQTYGELKLFARKVTEAQSGTATALPMLAMFCLAMRREVYATLGPIDERFEIGMFEDDDYARRVRQMGLQIMCAEDVFIHHFGQGTFGELCKAGQYDEVFTKNRHRFEEKWGVTWQAHGRRVTPEYETLRARIQATIHTRLASSAPVAVISKGDDELLKGACRQAWHFPQREDGTYPHVYPADSAEAIAELEKVRGKGARYLLIPKPALWWLEHYRAFRSHLEQRYSLFLNDSETCLVYDLGGGHV